jgi:ATP-binding cassette subfamily C (CFTR/MRP) protein 1
MGAASGVDVCVGFRLKAMLVHQVFRKVLRLTPTAQQRFSSGKVFNLVTSDAETLQALCQNILGVISSPARIIGAMVLLYVQLGPASLVALATLVIMIPIMVTLGPCSLPASGSENSCRMGAMRAIWRVLS